MTDEQTKKIICEECVHKEVCKIKSLHKLFNYVITYCNKFLKERVDDAPTIEVEPVRHGEWKVIRLHNNGYYFVCSECNEEGYLENYCSNCGAKMEEKLYEKDTNVI